MGSFVSFVDRLVDKISEKRSILCVGLDPQPQWIPEEIFKEASEQVKDDENAKEITARAILIFNKAIIEAVKDLAVVVKPQIAFYEAYGSSGIWAFEETIKFAKKQGLLIIEDAKRCDGGDTAKFYAQGHLGEIDVFSKSGFVKEKGVDADAMTVIPWTGLAGLDHFIRIVKEKGKGIFVVVKTSFRPNSAIEQIPTAKGTKMWEEAALLIKQWAQGCGGKSGLNNIGVVVGATYPEEASKMREIYPDAFFLVPGYGAQGGGAEGAVAGVREDGLGVIVNSSRGIIFAYERSEKFKDKPENFAESAKKAAEFSRDELNQALEKKANLPW